MTGARDPALEAISHKTAEDGTIGVLAGSGALPEEIVRDLRRQDRAVHVVAFQGSAEPGGELTAGSHTWTGIGQIKRMLGAFRAHDCREIIIAGGVRRPDLWQIRVDTGFFWNLPAILGLMRGGDDRLLRRVVRFFEYHGFTVRGMPDLTPELLASAGPMTAEAPTASMQSDAAVGAAAIAALGRYDVGQAVVVLAGRLCAIEGAEGTDGMLRRLAARGGAETEAASSAGGILVKLPKPGQDTRVDLPTIGPDTISNAHRAGVAGIAVQHGATAIVGRTALRAAADAVQMPVWGIAPNGAAELGEVDVGPDAGDSIETVGRHRASGQDLVDCAIGHGALAAARQFGQARGAIVIREHVLAISMAEAPGSLVARSSALRQWGDRDRKRQRRRGVLVVPVSEPPDREIVDAVADAGLSAILVIGADQGQGSADWRAVANQADARGVVLLVKE